MHIAAEKMRPDILSLLVFHDVRQIHVGDESGWTPGHKAAYAGSGECVRILLENGADLSARTKLGETVLAVIFKRIPRPINLITEILNKSITCNKVSINSTDFKLFLGNFFIGQDNY